MFDSTMFFVLQRFAFLRSYFIVDELHFGSSCTCNMHFILILAHIYVYAAAAKMHIRILATAAKNASSVFADQ